MQRHSTTVYRSSRKNLHLASGKSRRAAAAVALAIGAVASHAAHADTTWVGGTIGAPQDWFTASNWNNGLPSPTNGQVNIKTTVNYPILNGDASAGWDIVVGGTKNKRHFLNGWNH